MRQAANRKSFTSAPAEPRGLGIQKHRKLLFLVSEAKIDTATKFSLKLTWLKWSNFFILGSTFFVIWRLLPHVVTLPESPWIYDAISGKIRSKDSQEAEQWKTRGSKGEKWWFYVLWTLSILASSIFAQRFSFRSLYEICRLRNTFRSLTEFKSRWTS